VIDSGLSLTDVDDSNMESATISISGGFVSSEDVLSFANANNITGNYNTGTGVLTLSGTDLAQLSRNQLTYVPQFQPPT